MFVLILQIAFFPLIFISLKLIFPNGYPKNTRSAEDSVVATWAMMIIGVFFLCLGVWGYFSLSSAFHDQSKISVITRGFVARADLSKDPVLYWIMWFVFEYVAPLFCTLLGYVFVRISLEEFIHPPMWKGKNSQWQCRTSSLVSKASFNHVWMAIAVESVRSRGSALTAHQLHEFLWRTRQQFPRYSILLPRTTSLDPLIAILTQAGCIHSDTIQPGPSSLALIRQVSDPNKSRPYEQRGQEPHDSGR